MEKSESGSGVDSGRRVGLIYDERMCNHFNPYKNEYHPENPDRIRSIWDKLQSAGIHNRFSLSLYHDLLMHVRVFVRIQTNLCC